MPATNNTSKKVANKEPPLEARPDTGAPKEDILATLTILGSKLDEANAALTSTTNSKLVVVVKGAKLWVSQMIPWANRLSDPSAPQSQDSPPSQLRSSQAKEADLDATICEGPNLASVEEKLNELKDLVCSGNAEIAALKASIATATSQTKEIHDKVTGKSFADALRGHPATSPPGILRLPTEVRRLLENAAPSPAPKRATPSFDLVFKAKDPNTTQGEAIKIFREKVPFDGDFAPLEMRRLGRGRVLLKFASEAERKETNEAIEATGLLEAEHATVRNPLIILKGVRGEIAPEHLVATIRKQNSDIEAACATSGNKEAIRFAFKRRNYNDALYNAVLEVAPEVAKVCVTKGRVHIGHLNVHVASFSRFLQCYACQGFGHTQNKCEFSRPTAKVASGEDAAPEAGGEEATTKEARRHFWCANCSADHATHDCPVAKDAKKRCCVNCKEANKNGKEATPRLRTNHAATSNECPIRHRMVQRANEMTAEYGL